MSNSIITPPLPPPVAAHCTEDGRIIVALADGRRLDFPADITPRLRAASYSQRNNIQRLSLSLHWPDVDEDITIESLFELGYGDCAPSRESKPSSGYANKLHEQ
jgi:transglutaminase-like putative cysteine protease